MEEWVWDKGVLKSLSHHYKTGESLPDEMIDKLLALKQYDRGSFVQGQVMLSILALDCFAAGATKDVYALARIAAWDLPFNRL